MYPKQLHGTMKFLCIFCPVENNFLFVRWFILGLAMGSTAVLVHEQVVLPHFLLTQNKWAGLHLPPGPTPWSELSDSMVQEREVYPCWTRWALTLLLGKGTGWVEGQADFAVAHTLRSETWARRPGDSLYHLTPWPDVVRDCFCL